jgi:hypothetical protein
MMFGVIPNDDQMKESETGQLVQEGPISSALVSNVWKKRSSRFVSTPADGGPHQIGRREAQLYVLDEFLYHFALQQIPNRSQMNGVWITVTHSVGAIVWVCCNRST